MEKIDTTLPFNFCSHVTRFYLQQMF